VTNPFLRRASGIGASGRQAERKTAKRLGAKLTPNSGAMVSAKGDMKLWRFLIEAKSTVAASIALKLEWLLKISAEARSMGQRPALTVTFTNADGSPIMNGRWVLVPETVYQEMMMDTVNKD
jgi:hypothetical protein